MFTDTYEPQINGVVTSIKIFTKYLRKDGHDVHIFCPNSPNFKHRDKFVHTFKSMKFVRYPEYRIALPYYLPMFRKKFDIVHIHTPASVGLIGLLFAKYHKIPIIGHFHTIVPEYGHYITERAKKITKSTLWNYSSLFYNRCNCVIAPSNYIKKMLERYMKVKIVVIPTPIEFKRPKDKRKLRKKYEKKYNLSEKDKILLHVGRITKEKNITSIIHAIKKIHNENVKLIISSDGPYRDELEKKVRGMKNVIFTGYLSDDELDDMYSLSDVFVFASKTETQALVLLEAVSHGLPVVILDTPVLSEFVLENGVGLVANKNDFSKKIIMALNTRDLKTNVMKMKNEIQKKYNPERCTKELVDVYNSIIGA